MIERETDSLVNKKATTSVKIGFVAFFIKRVMYDFQKTQTDEVKGIEMTINFQQKLVEFVKEWITF